ncbi:hypothetical protein [uncultured Jatrophihabitans sp.]|uniref:hypothetical protein n=1 Tax=uncultured Jatrophihabitans sp. TaxID=1610747 RepID=UPI0035CA71C7
MDTDPTGAAPRPDLTFLRRRSRPRPAAAPPPAAPPTVASTGGGIDYTRPDRAHRDAPAAPTPPTGTRPKIDFSRPGRRPATSSGGVDYTRPSAPAPSAPSAPSAGGSLDLSTPSATPGPAPTGAVAARPKGPALRRHEDRHVSGREQVLLGVATPTVTLTRVQSGVGHLTVEAVCSGDVGDLRLGALYQFRSGGTSTVQLTGGNRFAPSSRRPVIVAGHEDYERLSIDLRQIGDVERITVYAFSESRQALTWGGTLVLETFGGGRIELPLETLYSSTVGVLVSLYNLDGELVVRAEMESIAGDVREAARAYGYDRITWRDDRTPVD